MPVTADVYRTARKFMKTFQKFDRSEGLRHRSVSATPVSNCVLIWGFPHIRCTILGIPIIRIILGSILVPPYFGNLPFGMSVCLLFAALGSEV